MSAGAPALGLPSQGLAAAKARLAAAAKTAGRDPAAVTLIAVSKTFDSEAILPVIEAGQRHFGENRVQEAERKWLALRARFPGLHLHLIGALQTNKARDAVALFDSIHVIDRPRLAEAIAREMVRLDRRPELFVQVNTGEEAQKAGVAPRETEALVRLCRDQLGLAICGLMCIPPANEDPAPHFARLRSLGHDLGLAALSMGMSADFETAIAEGATHVRVGSLIFGSRG